MNQDKLDLVKKEMIRININMLGISGLKWTGIGEFNSDDHYFYYCGQEFHRRNGVALIINKRFQSAVLGCNLKNDRMILVCFQGKPFSITVIQVCAPTTDAKEAEVDQFWEDLKHFLEVTPKNKTKCSIHHWVFGISQEIPGVTGKFGLWRTKWSRAKVNWILPREFVTANTLFQQHKR